MVINYDIFISYRRKWGGSPAQIFYEFLDDLGFRVFYDMKGLGEGPYNKQIRDRLDECRIVLAVMTPGALDPRPFGQEDWVRRELLYARKQGKKIIPILVDGFTWPQLLPKELSDMELMQSVEYNSQILASAKEHLLDILDKEDLVREEQFVRSEQQKEQKGAALTDIPSLSLKGGVIGREHLLEEAERKLRRKPFLQLCGVPGIGKAVVAAALCNKIKAEGKADVAWIVSSGNLRRDLLKLDLFPGSAPDLRETLVMTHLRRQEYPLFIFLLDADGGFSKEERALLNSFSKNVHVLVTVKRALEGLGEALTVDYLPPEDAVRLFYAYYTEDPEQREIELVRKIVTEAGRHSKLVILLAAEANEEPQGLAAFYESLRERGIFRFSSHVREKIQNLYDVAVLSPEQQRIMRFFCLFEPREMIFSEAAAWAGFEKRALRDLLDRQWVERDAETRDYWVHGIVNLAVRGQTGGAFDLNGYGELLENAADVESYISKDMPWREIERKIRPAELLAGRLIDEEQQGEAEARLYYGLATAYDDYLGRYQEALAYVKKALEIRERVLPSESLGLADSYEGIGIAYSRLGDYTNNLKYAMKALEIREKVLDPDSLILAASYHNVGAAYSELGDYKKALEYKRRALEIWEKVSGSDDLVLARSYQSMSLTYEELGAFAEALEYGKKALSVREKKLSPNHPDLAWSYHNIGSICEELGNYAEALQYQKKALSIFERVLSPNHPDMASGYNNIGVTYRNLGDYARALKYYKKALAIRERSLSADHPDLASSYSNIGIIYDDLGDYAKGLKFYKKALAIREKSLPADHPDLAVTYNNIGTAYAGLENYTEALAYFKKALAIRDKSLPDTHPDLAVNCGNIGADLWNLGEVEEAIAFMRRALAIYEASSLPKDHPDILAVRQWLYDHEEKDARPQAPSAPQDNYREQGDEAFEAESYDTAVSYYLLAFDACPKKDTEARAELLDLIAECRLAKEEYDKAIESFEQELEILEESSVDPEDSDAILLNLTDRYTVLRSLADACESKMEKFGTSDYAFRSKTWGFYDKARELAAEMEDAEGEAAAISGQARIHLLAGDKRKAAACYREVKELLEAAEDGTESYLYEAAVRELERLKSM